ARAGEETESFPPTDAQNRTRDACAGESEQSPARRCLSFHVFLPLRRTTQLISRLTWAGRGSLTNFIRVAGLLQPLVRFLAGNLRHKVRNLGREPSIVTLASGAKS